MIEEIELILMADFGCDRKKANITANKIAKFLNTAFDISASFNFEENIKRGMEEIGFNDYNPKYFSSSFYKKV